jgi:nucleotide-binding universal stress UspA family protein
MNAHAIYKHMLVPLDGSEMAEVVFPYAGEITVSLKLEQLTLLHVIPPEEKNFVALHKGYIEKAAETVGSLCRDVQHTKHAEVCAERIQYRGVLAIGHPAEEILRYAEDKDVDLILMATRGRTGVQRWTMGSIADKVLRASKVPVWLVRAGLPQEIVHDHLPIRRILVALDGSELAEFILPYAEAMMKQSDPGSIEILLLSVCDPTLPATYYAPAPCDWDEMVQDWKRQDERYLAKIEKQLRGSGLNVRSEMLTGKPAETIVEDASKNRASLIVMSTHGRSGLGRWVFGSVSEKVLHGVTIPILLLRPH